METTETGGFYGIRDFRGLFWKSQIDWHRLQDSDDQKRSYALFDLVTTLNHLWEWFLKDESIDMMHRVECARRFNPFEKRKWMPREFMDFYETLCPFPPENERQSLVRRISNRAKHATDKPKLSTTRTKAYLGAGDPRAFAGTPLAVCGYHVIVTSNLAETDGGELCDVKVVCEDLREEWNAFLKQTGLILRS